MNYLETIKKLERKKSRLLFSSIFATLVIPNAIISLDSFSEKIAVSIAGCVISYIYFRIKQIDKKLLAIRK